MKVKDLFKKEVKTDTKFQVGEKAIQIIRMPDGWPHQYRKGVIEKQNDNGTWRLNVNDLYSFDVKEEDLVSWDKIKKL